MAKHTTVTCLEELRSRLSELDSSAGNSVFILFTGNKDENGESWCGDCKDADPVLKESFQYLNENSEFITCYVGDRPTWKNSENEFRTDAEFKIKSIPTLVQWKTPKALVEQQCADKSLVQMLFEESQ